MNLATIAWKKGKVRLIDQSQLPQKLNYIYCRNLSSVVEAIKTMKVRGAPALGIAAALGIALAVQKVKSSKYKDLKQELNEACKRLRNSRPTAVNIYWATERIKRIVQDNKDRKNITLKRLILDEALKVIKEDQNLNRAIGRNGSKLLKKKDSVLTYCNAGALATADYGTALGVIYSAVSKGKQIKVYACETRPKLQGSRLTVWELLKNKVDVTLICDNTAAVAMKEGKIKKVIVGADRIALNGDTANKIGTYNLALLAKYHKIPFYIAAPLSTVDGNLKTGKNIPIEQRDSKEVIKGFGKLTAPEKVKVYNPAFDVTPAEYITAIITEKGVIKSPYRRKLKRLKKDR